MLVKVLECCFCVEATTITVEVNMDKDWLPFSWPAG
jgi:hypothetical protein